MVVNLFSVFDPTSYFGIPLNWVVILFVLLYLPVKYYLVRSGFFLIFKSVFLGVRKVFGEVAIPFNIGLNFLCVITFLYLILLNLLRLFPFTFTGSAHPVITIGFGVVLWSSFFIIGWTKSFKECAAHLVPIGAPIVIAPLIVLIERVSHIIRPFTLSIRLAANIIAGHLIIGLLSRIRTSRLFGLANSYILQRILLVLEFAVSVIQAFVFSILLLLYALEYY